MSEDDRTRRPLAENSSSDAQRHAELAGYEAAGGVTNAVLGARSSD